MKNKLLPAILICSLLLSGCTPKNPLVTYDSVITTDGSMQENAIPKEWKDASITDEKREFFFDLVKEYRIDAMREFAPGEQPELELFKWYCAHVCEIQTGDDGSYLSGEAVEKIANERFGFHYDLKADAVISLKAGSLMDTPFAEVIQYKEEKIDGKTLVKARLVNYTFSKFLYNDRVEEDAEYPAYREMILKGDVSGYDGYALYDVAYYTEDGKTPTQFISFSKVTAEIPFG